MYTGDWTEIVTDLRVWAGGAYPATVDLEPDTDPPRPPGCVTVHLDNGRVLLIDPAQLRTHHPSTGQPPPPLGRCRWILACQRDAVRMHPHPLMSPVPVCRHCVQTFHLH